MSPILIGLNWNLSEKQVPRRPYKDLRKLKREPMPACNVRLRQAIPFKFKVLNNFTYAVPKPSAD
jgi:hypothetical protein